MAPEGIKAIIAKGEGLEAEFKESFFELNKSVFETICAFLNRQGGHMLLGVKDDGNIEGVLESEANRMIDELVTNANNQQKLSPTFYLAPELQQVEGKTIIYLYVPESSQVHQTAGKTFDRTVSDGDIDITRHNGQVAQLYLRKQRTYSENRIFPFLQLSDFRTDLIQKARVMAGNQRANHPWLSLSDADLLRSAGLYLKDYQNGQEGYSLAAALLLAKDQVLQQLLPHYRTDAIARIVKTDRYDDRDDIRCNLLESYDRLFDFVRKHLPDSFFIDPVSQQRMSLRDSIFREVIANLLVHREFSNPFPAKFIIEANTVETENWNRPHGNGLIDPALFSPYPKNPVIARFFKEIGLVEELGSGLRNIYKYTPFYSNGLMPSFTEADIFRGSIPLPKQAPATGNQDGNQDSNQDSNQDGNQDGNQDQNKVIEQIEQKLAGLQFVQSSGILIKTLEELIYFNLENRYTFSESQLEKIRPYLQYSHPYWKVILDLCKIPRSKQEIFDAIGVTKQTKNFKSIVEPLIHHGMLDYTLQDRPTSRYQKYITTVRGKKMLQMLNEENPNQQHAEQ